MQTNLDNVLTGIGLQGTSIGGFTEVSGGRKAASRTTVLQHTMIGNHALLFGEVPGYLPASDAGLIEPIINFLGSPDSAILMGDVGPVHQPVGGAVQLHHRRRRLEHHAGRCDRRLLQRRRPQPRFAAPDDQRLDRVRCSRRA